MAFITVYFPATVIAHINVNWLSPVKVRTTLIGGSDKMMLVWNDLEADREDQDLRQVGRPGRATDQGLYQLLVSYRTGDMWAPSGAG